MADTAPAELFGNQRRKEARLFQLGEVLGDKLVALVMLLGPILEPGAKLIESVDPLLHSVGRDGCNRAHGYLLSRMKWASFYL